MSTAYTPAEVARELKVGRSKVYELIRDGLLRPIEGLTPYRISQFELDRFCGGRPVALDADALEAAVAAATAWTEPSLSLVGGRRR